MPSSTINGRLRLGYDCGRVALCPIFTRCWRDRTLAQSVSGVSLRITEMTPANDNLVISRASGSGSTDARTVRMGGVARLLLDNPG